MLEMDGICHCGSHFGCDVICVLDAEPILRSEVLVTPAFFCFFVFRVDVYLNKHLNETIVSEKLTPYFFSLLLLFLPFIPIENWLVVDKELGHTRCWNVGIGWRADVVLST